MRRIAWEDHTAHRGAVELESTGNSKKEHDMFNRFRFPARVRLIDGGSGEGGSGEGNEPEPKSFTQEQVDQIVERRLAKERGKYKDYDEFKSKAMRLDEMENAGKSELDKLKESNAALRSFAAISRHMSLCWLPSIVVQRSTYPAKTRASRPNCSAEAPRTSSKRTRTSCKRHCIRHPSRRR